MKIPYVNLKKQYFEEKSKLIQRIKNILDSGQYVGGDEVKKFENKISSFLNVMSL